jgi:hypothetical protein
MIPDVDQALSDLLRSRAVPGGQVEISFEAPTRDWAAARNVPTVNAYLYDITEDAQRRAYGLSPMRDESGIVVARRRPIRYFRLSYLLTCWTRRPEDEHRLLAAVLACLIDTEALPVADGGALASLGTPVELTVAAPADDSRSTADLWSALGGNLKPSLNVTAVTPFPPELDGQVEPPVTEATGVVGRRIDAPDRVDPVRLRRVRRN